MAHQDEDDGRDQNVEDAVTLGNSPVSSASGADPDDENRNVHLLPEEGRNEPKEQKKNDKT